jgi:hypothetical protein
MAVQGAVGGSSNPASAGSSLGDEAAAPLGGESNQHSGRIGAGAVVYGSGLRRRWLPRGPEYQQQAGGGAHSRSPFRASHGRVLHPGRLTRMIAPLEDQRRGAGAAAESHMGDRSPGGTTTCTTISGSNTTRRR